MAAFSPQYDYIFAIGMIFAFLDAWNIGANDVANSFATSVSSKSLTMMQAMMIASVMEFSGAIFVGGRVADTIRNNVVKVDNFTDQPAVLMLGMCCAVIGSSVWLTIATRMGMPVSTTHCIIGGVIGFGVAALGADGVSWGWNGGKGVATIFASWFISPGIAGAFAAAIFLITKYGVLLRSNPLRKGFIMVPIYFGITSGILTMLIVWKGAANLDVDDWTAAQIAGCIFGVGAGVTVLSLLFFVPFLYRKLAMEDWQLKWYDIFYGPLLFKRGEVPPPPPGMALGTLTDYYAGRAGANVPRPHDVETPSEEALKDGKEIGTTPAVDSIRSANNEPNSLEAAEVADAGPWYKPKNLVKICWDAFMHGVRVDVVAEQGRESKLAGNLDNVHAHAMHFDNKTEHLYSFLQVLTAATASFAHGANDVSNAIGPLTTIYIVWSTGMTGKKTEVPLWILAYGGAAIVIGLWTYGYNIMRNLGNRLTLQSPSRGFSIELGAAVTVVMATRLALPVSTTQCLVGATMGVAFCNGDIRALNWRMVLWCYAGWLITLPVAGIIAGCIMGIIVNAPHWAPPAIVA